MSGNQPRKSNEPQPQAEHGSGNNDLRPLVEKQATLQNALAELPGDSQQLLRWKHHDGLSFSEIASRLGCTADDVRRSWARAVEQLNQCLKQAAVHGRT